MKTRLKRYALIFAMFAASVGCGVDYSSIVTDAHDMVQQSQSVIAAQCGPGDSGDVCVKLTEASLVATNLLQIADFAIDTGTDIAASANIAWNYAQSLAASVKTLLGIKAIPSLARAAPTVCAAKDASPKDTAIPRELLLHPLGGEVPK